MNGLRKCGIYMQWNFTQPQRRMKFCCLHVNGWNWRTSSEVKLARFRKPKATCFLSYAENRPNTNRKQYFEKQVMLRGDHIQERKGKLRKLRSEYG
jgi:hypothetical protein